jgi:stage II sporulation protein D
MISKRFSTFSLFMLGQLAKRLKPQWWTPLFFWVLLIAPARAELQLRVAIKEDVSQVTVGSSTPATVRDASGQVLGQIPGMGSFAAASQPGGVALDRWQGNQIWIEPSDGGYVYIGDRWYRGRTLLVRTPSGMTAVNYVDLEEYLYSVLGGEMNGNWPQEALKAQAVAARSYALYRRQTSANTVYDVGNTVSWQVYRGLQDESAGTQAAVQATAGQVLTYDGKIIEAVFHSSSGGHTENVENVWSQPLPYLRGVPDFDKGAPVYEWTEDRSAAEVSQRISGVGNVISIAVERKTPFGRALTVRVVGDAGEKVLSGNELRRALGLRSTLLFSITSERGPVASADGMAPSPNRFRFNGGGYGHGLGLSQWGAHNMAQQGQTYDRILAHYYTGTTLSRIEVR